MNVGQAMFLELCSTNKTTRLLWFASWERLTYREPLGGWVFQLPDHKLPVVGWRAPCRLTSPCLTTVAPSQARENFQSLGPQSIPGEVPFVLLGKMPTVEMWEKHLLIFFLFICVTSCVLLLGFPWTKEWVHSRKSFADGFVLLTGL